MLVIFMMAATSASAAIENPIWTSNGSPLTYGVPKAFGASSVTGLNMKWQSSGIPLWVQCSTLESSGTVENPASGVPGTFGAQSTGSKFKGCNLIVGNPLESEGTGCRVDSELPVSFLPLGEANSTLTKAGPGKVHLELPYMLMTFEIKSCHFGLFANYVWKMHAQPVGEETSASWPGELLFTDQTGYMQGGGTAELDFGLNVEGSGGTHIKSAIENIEEEVTPGHHYWYHGGGTRRGEGPRTRIAAGSPFPVSGGSTKLKVSSVISGVGIVLECTGSGSVEGNVENPIGGGDGIGNLLLNFGGCSMNVPKLSEAGCKVETGGIHTGTLAGTTVESGEKTPYRLTPAPGSAISQFRVTGCKVSALNGEYSMTGSLLVQPHMNSGSQLGSWSIPTEANAASTQPLRLRGQSTTVSGEMVVETGAKEVVTLG
jgi:hypothetical protein